MPLILSGDLRPQRKEALLDLTNYDALKYLKNNWKI